MSRISISQISQRWDATAAGKGTLVSESRVKQKKGEKEKDGEKGRENADKDQSLISIQPENTPSFSERTHTANPRAKKLPENRT